MPFFSFSIIILIDDLLTALTVLLGLSSTLYLIAAFIIGVLNYRKAPTTSNLPKICIQDEIVPFQRPLTHLTIRQLKQRARTACIPRYSRMRKLQLIAALQAL